jgi:hypothetical protein
MYYLEVLIHIKNGLICQVLGYASQALQVLVICSSTETSERIKD